MIWLRYKIPSSYNPRLLAPTVSSVFLVETSLNPLHPDPALLVDSNRSNVRLMKSSERSCCRVSLSDPSKLRVDFLLSSERLGTMLELIVSWYFW